MEKKYCNACITWNRIVFVPRELSEIVGKDHVFVDQRIFLELVANGKESGDVEGTNEKKGIDDGELECRIANVKALDDFKVFPGSPKISLVWRNTLSVNIKRVRVEIVGNEFEEFLKSFENCSFIAKLGHLEKLLTSLVRRKLIGCYVVKNYSLYILIRGYLVQVLVVDAADQKEGWVGVETKITCQLKEKILIENEHINVPFVGYERITKEIEGVIERSVESSLPNFSIVHGVAGVGKTSLSRYIGRIFREKGISVFETSGSKLFTETVSKVKAIEESQLVNLFQDFINQAPVLCIIDDFDLIATQEDFHSKVEQIRAIAMMRKLIDKIGNTKKSIFILCLCRNIDRVDQSLRSSGRLGLEFYLPGPDLHERKEILKVHLLNYQCLDSDLEKISVLTPGYVGRDLEKICKMAIYDATVSDTNVNEIKWKHFASGLRNVQPSQMLDIVRFHNDSKINWNTFAGYENLKKRCRDALYGPIENPDLYQKLGLGHSSGILLFGPSGTGKTLMTKVLASLGKLNYINIRCPEIFSKYSGETESIIRNYFKRARQLQPCVLVFDELEALASKRGDLMDDEDSGSSTKALIQLLAEMDGIQERKGVHIIGCTNQKDSLDDAILRPGRLDIFIEFKKPSLHDRTAILESHGTTIPMNDVSFKKLAEISEGWTGAKLSGWCREAALKALENSDYKKTKVTMDDFLSVYNQQS